jgi:hemolysin activation/secretion protein
MSFSLLAVRHERPVPRAMRLGAMSFGIAAAFASQGAHAQAIERNLPPAPTAEAPTIAPPNAVPSSQDATPIGPALRAIVVLGAKDAALSTAADGVDLSRAPRVAKDGKAFARFLGRPISRRLIAEVEAEIARRYRAKGFPFVSVSTPEQEISGGVVQIRVVEFHVGAKTAPGASASDAAYIESRVRARPGEAIDAGELAQDLDWLNRYPYSRTQAVFTPGTGLGDTDLQLRTAAAKPWSAYAGYADSGSPLTGWDRYFAGAQITLPGLHDAVASYQFTGSSDVLFDDGRAFNSASDPRYMSQAGRLVIPTLARQDIEASVSFVRSNAPITGSPGLSSRESTYEATLAYRGALSDLWSALPGEAAIGVELKRQDGEALLSGAKATASSFNIFQLTLAYAQQESDAFGHTSGDLTVHISPGGADALNTNAALSAASTGQFDAANYAYVTGDLSRYIRLPPMFGLSGWGVATSLIGQYSAIALPLTEQIGLGGTSLVRGYTLDDGVFDSAVISRNELRAPAFPMLGRAGMGVDDQVSPYLFLDAGYGKNQRANVAASPVSAGLGADYQLGPHLTASLLGAWAVNAVGMTRGGEARLESRVAVSF